MRGRASAEATGRRPDASMDLLNEIRSTAVDPQYTRRPSGRRRRPRIGVAGLLCLGLLVGMGAAETFRTAPVAASEREDLLARIHAEEERLDSSRTRAADLTRQIAELERRAGGIDASTEQKMTQLATQSGAVPVQGGGLRITVDDGPDPDKLGSRVVDADLRIAVNALWASGAEAIAVNNHRLSSRTSIRGAGPAITVDYRSLTRPYRIEAIGDGREMESRFRRSSAGAWWQQIQKDYGMRYDIEGVASLHLAADPGLGILAASPNR